MSGDGSDLRLMRSLLEQRLRLAEEDLKHMEPNNYDRGYFTGCRATLLITLRELKAIEDRREKQSHD